MNSPLSFSPSSFVYCEDLICIKKQDIISSIFSKNAEDKITLGTLIGYEKYPFEINVQDLLCSHIGIFGNTGSGKSNTLAKLYREVVEKYKKTLIFFPVLLRIII